jgi:hypothetical protein
MEGRDSAAFLTAEEAMELVSHSEKRRLTRGMLQHYTREGYVRPRPVVSRIVKRGRPATVAYDLRDVVLLRWLVRLGIEGVKVTRFSQGIRKLRALMPEVLREPARLSFFVVGRGNYAVVLPSSGVMHLTGRRAGQVLLTFSSHPDVPETLARAKSLKEVR